MRRYIPRALAIASMALAALCVMPFLTCASPALVDTADAGATAVVETEPQEVEPVVDQEVTWEDVGREIRDSLSDDWPTMEDWRLYDPASAMLRFAKERDVDPIIVADEYADLADTVVAMQPDFLYEKEGGIQRALLVASDIYRGAMEVRDISCTKLVEGFDVEEGQVPRVNPYVLAAMGYRESHFMKRTEVGYLVVNGQKVTDCRWCKGSLGERGMFQFMPGGWIQSFMPQGCSPFDRMCSVRGAAKALATIRCMCIEEYGQRCNVDTFVAGYGSKRMPAPENALANRGVVRARQFLCAVRQDCDDFWPRDTDEDFALSL